MHELESSMISHVDADGDDLLVRFRNGGKLFRYPGQGKHLDTLKNSESAGKYFHQHLRGETCSACEE